MPKTGKILRNEVTEAITCLFVVTPDSLRTSVVLTVLPPPTACGFLRSLPSPKLTEIERIHSIFNLLPSDPS